MKRLPYGVALCALALGACQNSRDDTADNSDVAMTNDTASADMNAPASTSVDSAFVSDAMMGDNSEVAAGNLAATKAGSQAAKDFGKMLAADHGAHKDKLAALASSSGIAVTDEPSAEGKTLMDQLTGLSGDAFDKAFKEGMIADHQKAIAKYEKQAESGDAQTAALAKETLPTLRKHLETAQKL